MPCLHIVSPLNHTQHAPAVGNVAETFISLQLGSTPVPLQEIGITITQMPHLVPMTANTLIRHPPEVGSKLTKAQQSSTTSRMNSAANLSNGHIGTQKLTRSMMAIARRSRPTIMEIGLPNQCLFRPIPTSNSPDIR